MDGIKATFKLKGDKVEKPTMYLGANLDKKYTADGIKCWCMDSMKNVNEVIKNVEDHLVKHGVGLPPRAHTPFSSSSYHPAHNTTEELNDADTKCFQELIGILRWAVKLGSIDILLEVSLLSSHLALPQR